MIDRVAILCDFQNADYDQRDPTLLSLVDYFHCFHYPNLTTGEKKNFSLIEGDPAFVKIPFKVQTLSVGGIRPILLNCGVQIVAVKSGLEDFILETKIFDTSQICKFGGIQNINISETRNYITYDNDPYNEVSLKLNPAYDTGTYKGIDLHYAFVARYEYWSSLFSLMLNNCNKDIYNDNESVTNQWGLIAGGWDLKLRFIANVKGYDGFITSFQSDDAITILTNTQPSTLPNYSSLLEFFDSSNNLVTGVIAGKVTRIRTTFTSTMDALPAGFTSWYGTYFSDTVNGGSTLRRFASTEIASEPDTPFSSSPAISGATSQYSSGSVRIAFFGTQIIITETIYDDRIVKISDSDNIIIYPRLGFKP